MFNEKILNNEIDKIIAELQLQTGASKEEIQSNLKYLNDTFKEGKDKTPEELINILFSEVLNSTKAFTDEYKLVPGINVSSKINDAQMTAISGYTDGSNKERLSNDYMFDIASISKTYTSIILYQLLEEGLIHPNDKIKEILPDLSGLPDNLTLLEVTNYIVSYKTEGRVDDAPSKEKALEIFNTININEATRGTYEYNDMATMIFSRIIEKVTNKSYVDNVKERIIKPLDLQATELGGHIDLSRRSLLTGSQNTNKGLTNDPKANIMGGIDGNAGIFTNTTDCMKVLSNLIQGGFFKQNLADYYTINPKKNNRGIIGHAIIPKRYYDLPTAPFISTGGQGSTRTSVTAGILTLNGNNYILSNATFSNASGANPYKLGDIESKSREKEYESGQEVKTKIGSIIKKYENTDTIRVDIRGIVPSYSLDNINKELSKYELRVAVLQAYLNAYEPNYNLQMNESKSI